MVKLRDARGNKIDVPQEVRFIELQDTTGKVARLLIVRQDNSIIDVVAGTKEAEIYARNFNVTFCPVIDLTDQIITD